MAWLAVDRDGTEKICNDEPFRRGKKCYVLFGMLAGFYSKNNAAKWANAWSTNTDNILPFDGVIVPKSTIEKIIGKKLTWKDEPFELK